MPDVRQRFRAPVLRSDRSRGPRLQSASHGVPQPFFFRPCPLLRLIAVIQHRPRKSNTQTALRASSLSVFPTSLRAAIPPLGWAPSSVLTHPHPHSAIAPTHSNRTFEMPSFRASRFPRRNPPRPRQRLWGYPPSFLQAPHPTPPSVPLPRRRLTPACSGLAPLAADARR